jgi:hypothetical protein
LAVLFALKRILPGLMSRWISPRSDLDSLQLRDAAEAHDPLIERTAGNVFDHEIIDRLVLPESVNLDNIRMIKGRRDFGFAQKRRHEFLIGNQFGTQDLDRNHPVERDVPAQIDRTHASGTELAFQQEVAKLARDRKLVLAIGTGDAVARLEAGDIDDVLATGAGGRDHLLGGRRIHPRNVPCRAKNCNQP